MNNSISGASTHPVGAGQFDSLQGGELAERSGLANSADFSEGECAICWEALDVTATCCPAGHKFCNNCFRRYADTHYMVSRSIYQNYIEEGCMTSEKVDTLLRNRDMQCPQQPCREHPISAYLTVPVTSAGDDKRPSMPQEVQSAQSLNAANSSRESCCVIS